MSQTRIITIIAIAAGIAVLAIWGPAPKSSGPGNVLNVSAATRPDSLDPAMSYMAVSWQLMVNVYNGLLTYKKAEGEEGATLVPDLAEAMPEVLDDGTTYRFTMRKGVKWGPPLTRDITVTDVKYGIERTITMASPGSGFFMNLKGAEDFAGKKAKEISGIVVDEKARTIEFHLLRPDATFLYVLALPFSFAIPEGTEAEDLSTKGFVPASGPYMFKSYDPQRSIIIERNPNFKQWSPDVPAGNVDGVSVRIGVNPENATTLVQRGEVDYMQDAVPRSRLPQLLRDPEWKPHMYKDPAASTSYIFMNYRLPPFNNVKMRQAINWAIDRRAMVKLSGGVGVPSETVLPPSMPGFTDHELYPGPDIKKAKALVAESGVTPGAIDIWCRTTEPGPTFAVYLQDVLTQLGFKPTVKCVDSSSYFTLVGNAKTKALIGFGNWGQDFPEGSNFIDVLLNGSRITPEHNNNLSWYSGKDTEIAAANALLDQDARNAAWAKLDQELVADGAWAPFMHGVLYSLTSKRLENYTYSPVYGLLFMQVKLKGESGEQDAAAPAAAVAGAGAGAGAASSTGKQVTGGGAALSPAAIPAPRTTPAPPTSSAARTSATIAGAQDSASYAPPAQLPGSAAGGAQ